MHPELTDEGIEQTTVPLSIRLRLGRAAVQTIADAAAVDLLHIKGDAIDTALMRRSTGTDIDVLVRPADIERLHRGLLQHGWRVYSTYLAGSPFGHAQTYGHDAWGYVDVHRLFPGVRADPSAAFERLWETRGGMDFGGIRCEIPGRAEQAAILVLNSARNPGSGDLDHVWRSADAEAQRQILAVIDDLDAHTAFAAATGRLDDVRSNRDYLLWKAISEGGTRTQEWWGRIRAARSPGEAWAIAARAPLVNIEHLEHTLGHPPTRREIVIEFFARPARVLREQARRRW